MDDTVVELREATRILQTMNAYRDSAYLNMIQQINSKASAVLKDDMGSQFVRSCGRDLAGEVVRNCFNTSNYHITVDQLAKRILEFDYEQEYDPLAQNGGVGSLTKTVYNYSDNPKTSDELIKISEIMDGSQEKLFTEDRAQDKLDREGKAAYRESKKDANGDVYDELTGEKGGKTTFIRNGKVVEKSDLQADHIQARESATYNSRYVTERGQQALKEFWNSSDNMQMMFQSANSSKGDVRVCEVNGKIQYVNARSDEYDPSTDITSRATPEQLADAAIFMREKVDTTREQQNAPKIKNLKEKGYLNEDGKVPKSVRNQLIKNIRHSQNIESITELKNTKYNQVASDAADFTKAAIGKIIAGQVIYYSAPPLIYEIRTILQDKTIELENALEKLTAAGKRICEYVFSKLKDIFSNIIANSLKKFIKSFMDILINTVKATVKKLLKMAKNLVLSTVDAVRIIADKNATAAEKADSVVNLFGVTITSCVIEVMFEILGDTLHIPEPFDDIVFGPLQILATVVCTNLTMLILQKADLFDVRFGFKINAIRNVFREEREAYETDMTAAENYSSETIKEIIESAQAESRIIYDGLLKLDPHKSSVRGELEKVNRMFSMNINFEAEWLHFIGMDNIPAFT